MLKLAKKIELDTNSSYVTSDGWVVSDGVTANRGIIQTPGTRGNLAGAPVASWVGWVDVPTSNPTVDHAYAGISSSSTTFDVSNSLSIRGYANLANLRIIQWAALGSAARFFDNPNFRTTYSGQRIWLEVRITKGTGNPVVRVNGVDVSSSFSGSTVGTPPEWLDAGLVATNFHTGYHWPTGTAPLGCWLNAHLTDVESETWRITGRPPQWVAQGGNAANLAVNGDFSIDPTTANGGQYTLNAGVTWSGSAIMFNTAGGAFLRGLNSSSNPALQQPNRRYRVRVTISGWVSGAFFVTGSDGGATYWRDITGSRTISGNGTIEFEFTQVQFSDRLMIGASSGVLNATVDNLEIRQIGALSLPLVQQIPVLADWTLLKSNPARLLGMNPVNPLYQKSDIVIGSQSFSAGVSIQVLSGFLTGSKKQRIVSISGNSSASTTISIGTASGGTQLVNAQSVNGDFDISTFASRIIPASANIWVTFAGNTTAQVLIKTTNL